jgi:broad specificity phosphatase PhoE
MMNSVKVILVRHCQTNYNLKHLCNDDPSVDVHLTPTGFEQAEVLADKLKNTHFERIFISELRRTKQTADVINKDREIPVSVDSRLNDNRSGFEGKKTAEYVKLRNAAADRWTVRLNGGESIADVKQRVAEFINYLKETDYQSVLVVTSEMIVKAFYGIINDLSYEEWSEAMNIDNAAIIELNI